MKFLSGDNVNCSIAGLVICDDGDENDMYANIGNDEDEDSEKEDDVIKPDDNLVLLGHVEGDHSILEIFGIISFYLTLEQICIFQSIKILMNVIFFFSLQRK